MNRLSTRSAAVAFIAALGFAPFAVAQDQNPAVDRSVTSGNTTIFFKPAGTEGIDAERLKTWGEFAEEHPGIAKALAYNSSLMDNGAYLAKHPALGEFFQAHPDIKEAMGENPGNFVAIPPRPGE